MNFFGHAAIAGRAEPAVPGGVVLGAMLPDFATMCRARLAPAEHAELARGVALHHATDAAFHTLPAALGLMRELDERLAHGGCARGPRRAVAHIGTELLLDGVLVEDAAACATYLAGLAGDAAAAAVRWREPEGDARFVALLARLRELGVPADLREPDAVTERLRRMLAHRPLLAPSASDLAAVRTALAEHQRRVEIAADTVMRGTLARLAARPT